MAFRIADTLSAVQSYFLASGYVDNASIGEYRQPPSGVSAAIFMRRAGVARLTLNSTIETHLVTVRIYKSWITTDPEQLELELAELVSSVLSDLLGDYDLGGTIRNIDVGGQHGEALNTVFGHLDLAGTMYRIADIHLPFLVDDSATLVQ